MGRGDERVKMVEKYFAVDAALIKSLPERHRIVRYALDVVGVEPARWTGVAADFFSNLVSMLQVVGR